MDDGEFDELFDSEYESLTRAAFFIVGDLDLAREITQESFAGSSPGGTLFGVTRNRRLGCAS